ncbi:MAG: hypothetical protein ACPGOV_05835 [Magnetovibrionaceae bacterium]
MSRLIIATALVLALGSCQTTSSFKVLGAFPVEGKFHEMTLNWTDGGTTTIMLKPFENLGNLGLCGYYHNAGRMRSYVAEAWIEQSTIILTMGENRVEKVAGRFISPYNPEGGGKPNATCIETDITGPGELTNVTLDGPNRISLRI